MTSTVNMDKVMELGDMSDLMTKCVKMIYAICNDQSKTVIVELSMELLKEIQSIISEINVEQKTTITE